ncbi:MAG: hypothetical protein LBR72_00425 [Oscillospiraceae bacterium]|jgi:hypothetical protein|nr:hypothetical protein [Oscillospiraceae bacterium]
MRIFVILFLCLALLGGCGGAPETNPSPDISPEVSPPVTPVVPVPPEPTPSVSTTTVVHYYALPEQVRYSPEVTVFPLINTMTWYRSMVMGPVTFVDADLNPIELPFAPKEYATVTGWDFRTVIAYALKIPEDHPEYGGDGRRWVLMLSDGTVPRGDDGKYIFMQDDTHDATSFNVTGSAVFIFEPDYGAEEWYDNYETHYRYGLYDLEERRVTLPCEYVGMDAGYHHFYALDAFFYAAKDGLGYIMDSKGNILHQFGEVRDPYVNWEDLPYRYPPDYDPGLFDLRQSVAADSFTFEVLPMPDLIGNEAKAVYSLDGALLFDNVVGWVDEAPGPNGGIIVYPDPDTCILLMPDGSKVPVDAAPKVRKGYQLLPSDLILDRQPEEREPYVPEVTVFPLVGTPAVYKTHTEGKVTFVDGKLNPVALPFTPEDYSPIVNSDGLLAYALRLPENHPENKDQDWVLMLTDGTLPREDGSYLFLEDDGEDSHWFRSIGSAVFTRKSIHIPPRIEVSEDARTGLYDVAERQLVLPYVLEAEEGPSYDGYGFFYARKDGRGLLIDSKGNTLHDFGEVPTPYLAVTSYRWEEVLSAAGMSELRPPEEDSGPIQYENWGRYSLVDPNGKTVAETDGVMWKFGEFILRSDPADGEMIRVDPKAVYSPDGALLLDNIYGWVSEAIGPGGGLFVYTDPETCVLLMPDGTTTPVPAAPVVTLEYNGG